MISNNLDKALKETNAEYDSMKRSQDKTIDNTKDLIIFMDSRAAMYQLLYSNNSNYERYKLINVVAKRYFYPYDKKTADRIFAKYGFYSARYFLMITVPIFLLLLAIFITYTYTYDILSIPVLVCISTMLCLFATIIINLLYSSKIRFYRLKK